MVLQLVRGEGEDLGEVGQALTGGNGALDGGGEWQGLARLATLRYDYRNQMVEYEDQDGNRLHRFGYDCFGRRISKTTDANCVAFSTRVHHYVNGGAMHWQVLEEYESAPPCPCGGQGQPACPAMALAASFVYGSYIDEPISVRRDVVGWHACGSALVIPHISTLPRFQRAKAGHGRQRTGSDRPRRIRNAGEQEMWGMTSGSAHACRWGKGSKAHACSLQQACHLIGASMVPGVRAVVCRVWRGFPPPPSPPE